MTEVRTEAHTPAIPCARGCTRARQHVEECDVQECSGCLPRSAEHGRLCPSCHRRLLQWIDVAPAQVHLLRMVVGKVLPGAMPGVVETNAKIVTTWRTDSGQGYPSSLYAKSSTPAYAESEPIRTAALDLAQDIEDWLSEQVEMLVDAHGMTGPDRALSGFERDLIRLGAPPPARFVLGPACRWLAAQIGRLEEVEHIADLWDELGERMSHAHALAPWRQQASSLDGISCPHCQRMSLVLYGGDDFVTCTTSWCQSTFEWERYAIWARMLVAAREEGA